MIVQKIYSEVDTSEKLYSVMMSEDEYRLFSKELDSLYKSWEKDQTKENAKKYLDVWTREVYAPARKKGMLVDPNPSIVRSATSVPQKPSKKSKSFSFGAFEKMIQSGPELEINKEKRQKQYSLSGRLKASKKAYKDGKDYYGSPKFKEETNNIISDLEKFDPGVNYKSESAKKAARKNHKKVINKLKRDLNTPIKNSVRDAYYEFKSPYWEDRLYSDTEENNSLRTAAKVADTAAVGTLVGTGAYMLNKQHKAAQKIANKYGSTLSGGVFNSSLTGVQGTRSGQGVEVFRKYKQKLGKTGKIGLGVGAGLGVLAAGAHIASRKKENQ